ncbi:cation/H(+) antiporter 15-like [Actinidia eriantha]|uniref:cation/H(+) antiporter 15-like n=1 Tax=Actinidia eriantha TaxID=165200 RepID=UPI00258A790C|nr:cation/H(+) antiporter 15-like [Actinidia eriantha]
MSSAYIHEKVRLSFSYVCRNVFEINSRGIWLGDNPLDYSLPSLMLQLSLISIITRFVYVALKPFGQPSIVSQILVHRAIRLSKCLPVSLPQFKECQ